MDRVDLIAWGFFLSRTVKPNVEICNSRTGERYELLGLGIGDGTQQGVCALARVQPRVLNNDWNVRLNYAGVIGITRNGFRFLQIIKSEMLCSSRRHSQNKDLQGHGPERK